jgi:hypothetical protein
MSLVTCAQCKYFINGADSPKFDRRGVRYGSSTGIGESKPFTEFLAKNPSVRELTRVNEMMGNRLLYPNIERNCKKFEAK